VSYLSYFPSKAGKVRHRPRHLKPLVFYPNSGIMNPTESPPFRNRPKSRFCSWNWGYSL